MLALSSVVALAATLVPQDVPKTLRALAAKGGSLHSSVESIGKSRGGREIVAFSVSKQEDAELERPAILLVAGFDGLRKIDTELALHHCQQLVADAAAGDEATLDLLENCTVWVIPQLNPDGFALGRHGNASPLDLDRDGKPDEDGPSDVDGDGVVAHMRWKDRGGEFVIDEDEPRLLRKPDEDEHPEADQRYHYAIEARDLDGDEQRGEDDKQGIWIDRSFPPVSYTHLTLPTILLV